MDIKALVGAITSGDVLNEMAAKVGMTPDQAQAALHGVLDHATGGGLAEDLVGNVAAKTGLDPAQIQQFLPSVMGLLQGHADPNAAATDPAAADSAAAAGPAAGLLGMVSGLFNKKA